MSLFKRPLLAVGVSGFCALVLAALLPLSATVSLCILCAVFGLGGLFLRKTRKIAVCTLVAAVALLGFWLTEERVSRPLVPFDGTTVTVIGTVTDAETVSHGVVTATVRVTDGDLPRGTNVTLRAPFSDLPPVYGDSITAVTVLEYADSDGWFDTAKANRTFLSGWTEKAENFVLERSDTRSFQKDVACMRVAVAEALLSGMTQDVRPLLRAMCLGDKSELPDETITAFRRAGVSHLLVVSGLHTSIVAMGLYGLLRKLRVSRKVSSAAALLLLWAFALLVGFHPSVVRACVLNTFVLSGNLFRRRADGLNSLGGGLLLLWLCNPYCVYDVGLWLSFGATLGLLWWLPPMMKACDALLETCKTGKRPLRFLMESLCVTLAATLPILPICALVFGEVSLVAPLSNVLCVFAATLLLWCAAGALALSVLPLGFFAGGLRLCATLLARYLLWVTSLCGGFSFATVSTDEPYRQWWLVGTCFVVFLLWKFRSKRAAVAGFTVLCAVLVGLGGAAGVFAKGKTDVTVQRAYGDNAVLLRKDGATCVLVDGGNGWTTAKSLVSRADTERVDTVVVLDPARRLTRKWLEFNDSTAVGKYVLCGYNEKACAALKGEGETSETQETATLFDGTVSVHVTEERVLLTTSSGEHYTMDLTDTQDVSVRLN